MIGAPKRSTGGLENSADHGSERRRKIWCICRIAGLVINHRQFGAARCSHYPIDEIVSGKWTVEPSGPHDQMLGTGARNASFALNLGSTLCIELRWAAFFLVGIIASIEHVIR